MSEKDNLVPRDRDEQLEVNGEPQVYCADCFYYGDGRTFPGDIGLDIVQCPECWGERTFALTQAKKDEIDANKVTMNMLVCGEPQEGHSYLVDDIELVE